MIVYCLTYYEAALTQQRRVSRAALEGKNKEVVREVLGFDGTPSRREQEDWRLSQNWPGSSLEIRAGRKRNHAMIAFAASATSPISLADFRRLSAR